MNTLRIALLGLTIAFSGNASAADETSHEPTLVAEVDGCRTWKVMDDLGQGSSYARLEARTIFFTKCSASTDPSTVPAPIQGEVPQNAAVIAEVDGCRVWRVSDGEANVKAAARLEPLKLYFTKCGNMTVPTIEPALR